MKVQPKVPIALEFAGFWRRLGAFVIDLTVLGATASFLTPFHWFGFGNFFDLSSFISVPVLSIPFIAIANPVSAMLSSVYFVALWAWRGQTLGMIAAGIKLIRTDGTDVDTGHSITRLLGLIISALPLFLGLVWIAFDERNQGWHDKIAQTYVVKIPRMPEVNVSAPTAGA
ncbi:hypothetical protein DGWBC_0251 [Dehalogenimonas sp. WBC-2]|nr:hypothetical protein DGWBC_0251 [Dehalogenimonas sp. WBC-2]